jgi:hypothetical protein
MAQEQNLILCLAANYTLDSIEPFVASWRENVPTAKLVMFSMNMDQKFYDASARLGIGLKDASHIFTSRHHPQVARYFMYRKFMESASDDYENVLLTDVRDVVFQGDPFVVTRDAPVWFAAEDKTIDACPVNSRWLSCAYGEAVARHLATKTISCSGTTIGDSNGIQAYLDLLCSEAERNKGVSGVPGIDQGFHNYILWRLEPNFIALDTRDRVVNTIGHTQEGSIRISGNRLIVDGTDSALVHQWDRHAAVERHVRSLYRLTDFGG